MSKSKSEIIQNIYKNNYLCKNGHSITWEGAKHQDEEIICDKCGKEFENTNPIRWVCSKCNNYFCGICFNVIPDKICPLKHKYKFYKQNTVDYFDEYTCDQCFQNFLTKDGILFDKECSITFCPKCFSNTFDIPDYLED